MEKLQLQVGEYWLDIPDDIEVKYKWVNNIFHEETKQRDRSLSFVLQPTPINNKALNWLFAIGTPNDSQTKWIAAVFSGGTFLFHASLRVDETEEGYRIYLLGKFGSLDDTIKNDKLTDLNWTVSWPSLDETDVANGGYPTYPAWNPAVYFPLAHEDTDLISFRGLHNYLYSPFASVARDAPRHAPYILSILDAIADHYGIPNVDAGRFRSDGELQTLILLSVGRCEDLNALAPEGFLPDMKISDFKRLEIMFCCQFSINNTTLTLEVNFLKDSALTTDMVDWTSKLAGPIKRVWDNNVEALKLDFSESFRSTYEKPSNRFSQFQNVIDVTAYPPGTWGALSGSMKPWFGAQTIIRKEEDGTWIPEEYFGHISTLSKVDPDGSRFIGVYDTYADLDGANFGPSQYANKIAYVRTEHRYYYMRESVSKWVYLFTKNEPFEQDDFNTEFKSSLSAAFTEIEFERIKEATTTNYHVDDWWRLPIVKGATIPNKFPDAQLAFKRGIRQSWSKDGPQLNITGYNHNYTYASSDEFDTDGSEPFNYSLHWDGDKGLFKNWWEDWSKILIGGQEIEAPFNLTNLDIANLDLGKPVYVDGAKCYIKEIDLRIPIKGPTRVKLLKTPS